MLAPRICDALVRVLQDPDQEVRREALSACMSLMSSKTFAPTAEQEKAIKLARVRRNEETEASRKEYLAMFKYKTGDLVQYVGPGHFSGCWGRVDGVKVNNGNCYRLSLDSGQTLPSVREEYLTQ